ncbi:hypothetical protein IFM89_023057 [Coptis chinensis]|uniref:AMSH-like ubiquitin thioesterase 2 n=1 Tax=Coptis chinensis TaxID=261450 RepID=A0A835MDB3_9MAGN|nr:hypothetical protein IFM89_023057 [Coptis chinensis]
MNQTPATALPGGDRLVSDSRQSFVEMKETLVIFALFLKDTAGIMLKKMSQHSSYSTYSLEEKLHYKKIHEDFAKELQVLEPQLGNNDSQSPNNQPIPSCTETKVVYGVPETKIQRINLNVQCVTQSSPSPALTCIQSPPQAAHLSHIAASDSRHDYSQSSCHDVHISVRLMDDFLELARDNTNKDLETCGVLGAFLVMLPEAVAIVMAPTDSTRSYGIFRLSDPGGTTVLKECQERGFHTHQEPSDGSPIYEDSTNVYVNPNLRLEIFDLR